ncbi:phosphate ABC transporter permease PstA [Thermus sp.]|uniref:phosphate ABC transporter permease PstA n=1 Tax=Thermus sp. TaxID=275 RepID=UPI0025FC3967|nr:phosphate ABC transporter permease PstA [Thermus sp.]MCS6869217.1 phosphate ABC transporter permease PstA [Thermus sp.]MCX7848747.1 phosphate ABC transporter permease PstA [Thermus sp.]MDW8017725.1 phosphate ABC transporter permease PstA [Thermus sp.]MDW8357469.1 phosphate ABC transporter permease PstA [Thermus sp.]
MNKTLAQPPQEAFGADPWKTRIDRAFARALALPLILSIGLLILLLGDTLYRSVSVQVVRADEGPGKTYPFGLSASEVLKQELLARGYTEEEAKAFLQDPTERRVLFLQNRVELMWNTQDGPFRYVVTGLRDERVEDFSLAEGLRRWNELKAGLGEGERLVLNPWLDQSFLTRTPSRSPLTAGIGVAIWGTVWVLSLALLIAIPVGIGTAILLEEYLREGTLNRILEVNLRNLAGVPSIVYGLLGLAIFVRELGLGPTILAAALTLGLLGIPVIVVTSREALRAVPESLRQAAFALGATRRQVVFRVVVPAALPGMVTGVILSAARLIGEAAPLLLVGAAAYVPFFPSGPMSEYTVIPVQIYLWVSMNIPEFARVAAAGILVMLLALSGLYLLALYLRNRFRREW